MRRDFCLSGSSAPSARLECGTIVSEGPERWPIPLFHRPKSRPPDVGENQPPDMTIVCLSGDRQGSSMTADFPGDVDGRSHPAA